MKKKNIAFTGAMAAILFSAGANAATATKIASQKYVDDKESSILQTVSNTYATTETVEGMSTNITNITEQITNLGDTVNNAETGVVAKAEKAAEDAAAAKTAAENAQKDVDALEIVVGDETAGLVKDVADATSAATSAGTAADNAQKDVDALAEKVNSTTDGLATKASAADVSALTTRVSTNETNISKKADKITVPEGQAGNIATVNASGQYEISTVKATDLVTNETVTEKITTALEGNESVKEIITNIVGDGTVVTEAIDKSVASGTLKTELDKKADKATSLSGYGITDAYTKTETTTEIQNYAIPKPTENCKAASGTCVLSVNTSGNLEWVDVTAPLE